MEAGVCPVYDEQTGHAAVAFVVLNQQTAEAIAGSEASFVQVQEALTEHVRKHIGPIAKPKHIVFVPDVPKTRSGKIMRRLLTQLFEGTKLGDTTSLQNEPCIAAIAQIVGHAEAATIAKEG